jgi:hypothetical protein
MITGDTAMSANRTPVGITINNNAQSVCEHCGGVVRHEHWCITCDAAVQYAYSAVLDPSKLTFCDRLILHGLGLACTKNECKEAGKKQ